MDASKLNFSEAPVVNSSAKIGDNCRLRVCLNTGAEAGKGAAALVVGNNCYVGPGVKIFSNIYRV